MYVTQANIYKAGQIKYRAMIALLFGLCLSINCVAQEASPKSSESVPGVDMTQSQMAEIVTELVGEYEGAPNNLQFVYNDVQIALISDKDNNRMRLLAPIVSVNDLTDELLQASMVSNFHLALDARYAIGNGILYATYVHPLRELTK